MRRLLVVVALMIGLSAASLAAEAPGPAKTAPAQQGPFEIGLAAAKANAAPPEGRKFDEEIGAHFKTHHSSTMETCTRGVVKDDLKNFTLVARLAGDGAVQEVHVEPGTKVSLCFSGAVAKDRFPKPPRPDYWVYLEMTIRQ